MANKPEQDMQLKVCDYLRYKYPDLIFYSDFAAGLKLPIWLASLRRRMASGKGIPDLTIEAVRGNFSGLRLELKAAGVVLYKRDGTPRKNDHIAIQAAVLETLRNEGYCAEFAVGYDQAIAIIEWYMSGADDGNLVLERDGKGNQRFRNTNTGEIF